MTRGTSNANKNIILRLIREIIERTSEDERHNKVYFEGMKSYSLIDIVSEIETDSEFGKTFVKNIASTVKGQKISVAEFFEVADQ